MRALSAVVRRCAMCVVCCFFVGCDFGLCCVLCVFCVWRVLSCDLGVALGVVFFCGLWFVFSSLQISLACVVLRWFVCCALCV